MSGFFLAPFVIGLAPRPRRQSSKQKAKIIHYFVLCPLATAGAAGNIPALLKLLLLNPFDEKDFKKMSEKIEKI